MLIHAIEVNLDPWSQGQLVPDVISHALPMVIRPGEIKLLSFTLPNKFIYEMGSENVGVEIDFQSVSAKGLIHPMRKRLEPCVNEKHVPLSWFYPFRLDDNLTWQYYGSSTFEKIAIMFARFFTRHGRKWD